ncbi:hypothetical protein IMX07_08880 [bacterium]|nr:hypothetical protein [bacterium]
MPKAIAGNHIIRYGTPADQKFLLGSYLACYDQLALNANMIGHAPAAIASLVTQRLRAKSFFVDPQTHAFQHSTSYLESQGETTAGRIKRSIQTLLKAYGQPLEEKILKQRRPVTSKDFVNHAIRRAFCERVLDFQLNAVQNQVRGSDAAKYYEYLKLKGKSQNPTEKLRPAFLVAPYFYLTPNLISEWLNLNFQFAEIARKYADSHNMKLAIQVVLSREFLGNSVLREEVVSAYRQTGADLVLVWISAFSELTANEEELYGFVDLLRSFGEIGQVVNLYGSYFSLALKLSGKVTKLAAVAHGLEYGEDRDVVPVGGGIPVSKFYVPKLHSRLRFRDAVRVVRELRGFKDRESYFKNVCACRQCRKIIASNPEDDFAKYGESQTVIFTRQGQSIALEYPTRDAKERCVSHFMWCKKAEFESNPSRDAILDDLREAAKLEQVVGPEAAHCTTWSAVLAKL